MAVNVLLLLVLSGCWSVGYLFIAEADRALPPLTATAAMCGLAAVFLLVSVGLLRRPLVATLRQRPVALVLMGLSAIALPQLSDVSGQTRIGADVAALVGTCVPIFTFLLTTFVLRSQPYSQRRSLGVLVALAGLAVFLLWDDADGTAGGLEGVLVMASGGLVFAVNGVFAERITRRLDPLAVGAWVVTFGALSMLALALAVEGPPAGLPEGSALIGVVGDGLISIGLAFLLYYLLIGRAGADFAALYAYLVPLLGIGIAVLAGEAALTAGHLLGVAIVMLGVWLLVGGKPRPAVQRQAVGSTDPA